MKALSLLVSTRVFFCTSVLTHGILILKLSQDSAPPGTLVGFMFKNYDPSSCTLLTK